MMTTPGWAEKRAGTWLLLGYYGGDSVGDDAMLAGLLRRCNPAQVRRLTVLSKDGSVPTAVSSLGVRAYKATLPRLLTTLVGAEGIVQGGGTFFHDAYSDSAQRRYRWTLTKLSCILCLAHALGKKVALVGVGVGPVRQRFTKLITRLALRSCHAISVRDESSLNVVGSLSRRNRAELTFDLAALLVDSPSQEGRCRGNVRRVLGISALSLSPFVDRGSCEPESFWDTLGDSIARRLVDDAALRVKIFVMWAGADGPNDIGVSRRLQECIGERHPGRVRLIPYTRDTISIIDEMSDCYGFIATRYHAAMLAYLVGCRLLLVPYHKKVSELGDQIGLFERARLNPFAGSSFAEIEEKLVGLLCEDGHYVPRRPLARAVEDSERNLDLLRRLGAPFAPKGDV